MTQDFKTYIEYNGIKSNIFGLIIGPKINPETNELTFIGFIEEDSNNKFGSYLIEGNKTTSLTANDEHFPVDFYFKNK